MEHVTVKYWHRGFAKSALLSVDDQGFGIINDEAERAFTRGQCHALAVALHELTGWPIKGLGSHGENDSAKSPAHCVVWCPKLRAYVDIRGKVSRDHYRKEQGWMVLNKRVTASQIQNFKNYLKPNIKAAIPFAKTILHDLGEFSTGS